MDNQKEAELAAYAPSINGEAPPPYTQSDNHAQSAVQFPPSGPAPSYDEGGSSSGAGFTAGSNLKFPQALNGYYQMKFTTVFHLGEKKEAPLYAVRVHSGFTKNPELVLHDGPSENDPILATVDHAGFWKASRSILTIPSRDGVTHDSESQRIEMHRHWSLKHETFTFEADIGIGKETHREQFEWRTSHGDEVKELHALKFGWKLVRLSNQPLGGGGQRATRVLGSTSDGNEVVAVWAINGSMSLTKAFKFQFMGSALTGMMGDRWATAALISALRIWLLEMQGSASAGSAAGSSSSAAAAASC
ncbi:hypothetical protein F5Y19DRAFT_419352 [Xylariaceae sp. FL1651]|nr:hypothetical protein F5Y19DRAFT_419352 [Xylariaceae sp. FL1651]